MQNSITIRILGQDYQVRSRGDQQYVQALSKYINDMVADVQRQGNAITTMEVIAMTMLNMADDVNSARTELQALKASFEARCHTLVKEIDTRTSDAPWDVRSPT